MTSYICLLILTGHLSQQILVEILQQMKELETKGHEEENLRIESNERNGQNVEKQMVNEYEMERGLWEDQDTVKKKLETKEHRIEKQERKQQIESLIIENDEKKKD
ncbi:unnamed protein product [Parnassius apollo]|uniref:(apollo) hypothetical protein n=1 Tax=Parnassius apollo TaxID=110799 RepID=A0A8S3W439_PARAO|nr:unnamed protein product [Parnassius apollo]